MASERSLEAELYATFKKDVAFQIREIKRYLRNGGELTDIEITQILDRLFITFANDLEDGDPRKAPKWLTKAESLLASLETDLLESEQYGEVISQGEVDAQLDLREGYIELAGIGYPIFMEGDRDTFARQGVKRRGRTIVSLGELVEYVEQIPTVVAIEIVYNSSGVITGYRVWVADKS